MRTSAHIVDGFHPFPDDLRDQALELDYGTVTDGEGYAYKGWAPYSHEGFKSHMERLLSVPTGGSARIVEHSFVAGTEGFETTQWIHADSLQAGWACVLYLDGHKRGGTAFWDYRETGHQMQDSAFVEAARRQGETLEDMAARLRTEGNNEALWQMHTLCSSRFNRLVFYPSKMFHSRYPKEGWGATPEESRLVWVAFFDVG